jgi:hypothetical protein
LFFIEITKIKKIKLTFWGGYKVQMVLSGQFARPMYIENQSQIAVTQEGHSFFIRPVPVFG